MLFIKADGADIVLVDQQINALRRKALGLVQQGQCDVRAPVLRRDHDLVEIGRLGIDSDEAGHRAVDVRQHDAGRGHEFLAPAFAPPGHASVEVDMRIVLLPGAPPQLDGRVFVGGGVGPQA